MAIELKKKGEKISLEKKSPGSLGQIAVNLNWNKRESKKGFFGSLLGPKSVDLDLGCLFEMKDGGKGVVQALGNAFGNLNNSPYIALDADDRTGASENGENLRINGNMISQIKRILIYTFIYEGVANWQQVDGIVTVKCPGSQDIIVRMDEYNSSGYMCAIAMLENLNNETFSVERIVRFFNGHQPMDIAFNWGLQWRIARK